MKRGIGIKIVGKLRAFFMKYKFEIGKKNTFGKSVKLFGPRKTIFTGERVMIYRGTELCSNKGNPIKVGSDSFINQRCIVRPNVEIGDHVSIGPMTSIITDSHEIGSSKRRAGKSNYNKTTIENGCWIGASVTILGGVTIGSGSIVAAGAVVTKSVPENALVAGVPAQVIRYLN